MSRIPNRSRWLIVAAVVGVTAVAAVAKAAIPEGNGVIRGCYQVNQGQLRVIDGGSGETCRSSEQPLSWNQAGPPGPPGGAGPQGPAGPQGQPGLSGHTVVDHDESEITTFARKYVVGLARCPAGKRILGGGGSMTWLDPGSSFHSGVLVQSRPDALSDSWVVSFQTAHESDFPAGSTTFLDVYAVCATVS